MKINNRRMKAKSITRRTILSPYPLSYTGGKFLSGKWLSDHKIYNLISKVLGLFGLDWILF